MIWGNFNLVLYKSSDNTLNRLHWKAWLLGSTPSAVGFCLSRNPDMQKLWFESPSRSGYVLYRSVADPGFPRRGTPTRKWGTSTYYFGIFSEKLYEIEKWTKRRGRMSLAAFLNPPMDSSFKIYFRRQSFCDHWNGTITMFFVLICLVIISKSHPLSHRLLWFWWIES